MGSEELSFDQSSILNLSTIMAEKIFAVVNQIQAKVMEFEDYSLSSNGVPGFTTKTSILDTVSSNSISKKSILDAVVGFTSSDEVASS